MTAPDSSAPDQPALTLEDCRALDRDDPLADRKALFSVPDGLVYLDGNSLGALCRPAREQVERTLRDEWGHDLIRSWNAADWMAWPTQLGDRIGRLIGAAPGQTVVADSTSINLFKALVAAIRLNPGRGVMISEAGNFPSDLYITEGVLGLGAGPDGQTLERRLVPEGADEAAVEALLDDDVAVLTLTHVNYKTARVWDMARLTRAAHDAGVLVVWDLAHSAGAVAVDLDAADADFAVGCTYKYLNAGPGGPAYIYVNRRLQDTATQPLTGWLGHAKPFDFTPDYQPAPGIMRFVCGTPQILSTAALAGALDGFDGVSMDDLRAKSLSLTDLFIRLVDQRCGAHGLKLITPRDPAIRGSHVSWAHPKGYEIMRALIDRGVIGDFRAPDVLRFGFTPLYLSHQDVWRAVDILAGILDRETWREPKYAERQAVT